MRSFSLLQEAIIPYIPTLITQLTQKLLAVSKVTEPVLRVQLLFFFFFFFGLFAFSRAAPAAYGGSQARGPIGAVATGLRQTHSNEGSQPRLEPTPQLTATPHH